MSETTSNSFEFFTPLVFYVLFLYVLILGIYLIIRRYEIKHRVYDSIPRQERFRRYDFRYAYSFNYTTTVEDVINPVIGSNYRLVIIATRLLSTLVMFFVGLVATGITSPKAFLYFDVWNVMLVTLYFLLTTFISIMSRNTRSDRVIIWSDFTKWLSVCCHSLFEVCSVTTLLVLFIQWMGLNLDKPTVVAATYLALFALLFEMAFNNLQIRFDQFPATVSILFLYLLIIWPVAFNGHLTHWPYTFLVLDTAYCFLNYSLIFVAAWVCAVIWYGFYKIKEAVIEHHHIRVLENADRETIRMATMMTNALENQLERQNVADDDSSVASSSMASSASGSSRTSSHYRNNLPPPPPNPYAGFVPTNPYLQSAPLPPQIPPLSQPHIPMIPPPPSSSIYPPDPMSDMYGGPPSPYSPQPTSVYDPLYNPYLHGVPPSSSMEHEGSVSQGSMQSTLSSHPIPPFQPSIYHPDSAYQQPSMYNSGQEYNQAMPPQVDHSMVISNPYLAQVHTSTEPPKPNRNHASDMQSEQDELSTVFMELKPEDSNKSPSAMKGGLKRGTKNGKGSVSFGTNEVFAVEGDDQSYMSHEKQY